jgi:hypothetical protein
MAHRITHRCGHEATHEINGHYAADYYRQLERLEQQKCPPCRASIKQAKAAAAAQHVDALKLELCQLTGSIKQIEWAETIRVTRLAKLCRTKQIAAVHLADVPEAKWWIDHRSVDDKALILAANEHQHILRSSASNIVTTHVSRTELPIS